MVATNPIAFPYHLPELLSKPFLELGIRRHTGQIRREKLLKFLGSNLQCLFGLRALSNASPIAISVTH